jgi:hypothetical protein
MPLSASLEPTFSPRGTTRAVLCVGQIALKIARSEHGAKCNLYEADLYRRVRPSRRAFLCPLLWCSTNGAVLVMRRARPMTRSEFVEWRDCRFPDWNVYPPDDEEPCSPLEPKHDDWGWLDGRVAVALDYANIAREGEDEELERLP